MDSRQIPSSWNAQFFSVQRFIRDKTGCTQDKYVCFSRNVFIMTKNQKVSPIFGPEMFHIVTLNSSRFFNSTSKFFIQLPAASTGEKYRWKVMRICAIIQEYRQKNTYRTKL